MTLDRQQDNVMVEVFEALNACDSEAVRKVLEIIYNGVMCIEREQALGVSLHERSPQRQGYANGYKNKTWKTRMGALQLKVPQTRNLDFYPPCLEKGNRSERALKLTVAEMYLKGVSTRKVTSITKELCGLEISSSQVSAMTAELDESFEAFRNRPLGAFAYVYCDALYLKVRDDGSVMDQACLVAYGVNQEGKREILGISMELSEAEAHWRTFFEGLQKRGLHGVELIISDHHSGLRNARRAVLPSVKWQRCQFHMMQNAQSYAPKQSMREAIAEALREVFQSATRESAMEAKRRVIEKFEDKAPKFVTWLEENIEDGLTCLSFPQAHHRRIRTTNGLERVNREIKRRTKVAVLFPHAESALRLVTGVLIEIHEEWVTGKAYLDMSKQRKEE